MRARDPNVIQAIYAAPKARLYEWTDTDPPWILSAMRHTAAVLNLLQFAAVAFCFYAAFTHEPDEAPMLLLFILAPLANMIALWAGRGLLWVNAMAAVVNLAWILVLGGLLLMNSLDHWRIMTEAIALGPQALALGVQCVALGRLRRRRFQAEPRRRPFAHNGAHEQP